MMRRDRGAPCASARRSLRLRTIAELYVNNLSGEKGLPPVRNADKVKAGAACSEHRQDAPKCVGRDLIAELPARSPNA